MDLSSQQTARVEVVTRFHRLNLCTAKLIFHFACRPPIRKTPRERKEKKASKERKTQATVFNVKMCDWKSSSTITQTMERGETACSERIPRPRRRRKSGSLVWKGDREMLRRSTERLESRRTSLLNRVQLSATNSCLAQASERRLFLLSEKPRHALLEDFLAVFY